jgi:putative nucleotidyltransferase with HDIG domain
MANSSFYNPARPIWTVHQAVAMMGTMTVKCMVLSTAIFDPERIALETGLDAEEFFNYILSVSLAAEKIAETAGYSCTEEALISGLLHDIGIIFFLHNFPDEYNQVLKKQEAGETLAAAEYEIFGIDHCEVGYRLAKAWHFPDKIARAIADHHNTYNEDRGDILPVITRLAILLTFSRFSDDSRELQNRVAEIGRISQKLGIHKDKIAQIGQELVARVINMAENIGINIGETDRLLASANREIWKAYLTIERLYKDRQELNERLLAQEREKGATEAKNMALATLAHYVNNAVAVISGQFQILKMLQINEQTEKLLERLPASAERTNEAISKILAVMRVMREISPTDEVKFFRMSKAMNIDDRIAACIKSMSNEPDVVLPMEDK